MRIRDNGPTGARSSDDGSDGAPHFCRRPHGPENEQRNKTDYNTVGVNTYSDMYLYYIGTRTIYYYNARYYGKRNSSSLKIILEIKFKNADFLENSKPDKIV